MPGQLLGWSWPDRLRHALALAAGGAGTWTREPGDAVERDRVDLAAYERLLDTVRVDTGRVDTGRADPLLADPLPADPLPADPPPADPLLADPLLADPGQTELSFPGYFEE